MDASGQQRVTLAWSTVGGGRAVGGSLRVVRVDSAGNRSDARTVEADVDGCFRWRWPAPSGPTQASLTLHGAVGGRGSLTALSQWPPPADATATDAAVDKPTQWADGVETAAATRQALRSGVPLSLEVGAVAGAGVALVAPAAGRFGRVNGAFVVRSTRVLANQALFALALDRPIARDAALGAFRPHGTTAAAALWTLAAHAPIAGTYHVDGAAAGEQVPRPGARVEAGARIGRVVGDVDLEVVARPDAATRALALGPHADVVIADEVEVPLVVRLQAGVDGQLHAPLPRSSLLRIGQRVVGALRFGPGRDALVIPRQAVLQRGVEHAVFVATSATTFVYRDVVLGGDGGDIVEITAGLAVGERVVVRGHAGVEAAYAAARRAEPPRRDEPRSL